MDNILEREEFFKNESIDIADLSQTEVMAIHGMQNLISIPMEQRLYVLALMQNALRINFEEFKDYYMTNWLGKENKSN